MTSKLPLFALLLFGMVCQANALEITPVDSGLRVLNTSPSDLVAVRVGVVKITQIPSGQSVTIESQDDRRALGRYSLTTWASSLTDWSPDSVDFHLRTCGFLLDAVDPGEPGNPRTSANLRALRKVSAEVSAQWDVSRTFNRALVACAAQYTAPALVARLITQFKPEALSDIALPEAFQGLPPAREGLRIAIEAHGPQPIIIAALRAQPAWAQDRGFRNMALLDAFSITRTHIAQADAPQLNDTEKRLLSALESGEEEAASRIAVETALAVDLQGATHSRLARLSCAGLDSGARRAMRSEKWMAAYAYLRLAGFACGDRVSHRARVAEYYRRRGDASTEGLRLVSALDHYRAAVWFGEEAQDKIRLADTHAELAILSFRAKNQSLGMSHLESAREFGPHRERVMVAGEFKPEADPRARFGVLIIILFVAFFAFRRLFRLFSERRSIVELD